MWIWIGIIGAISIINWIATAILLVRVRWVEAMFMVLSDVILHDKVNEKLIKDLRRKSLENDHG